jgi:hypothetical protein
MKKATDKIVASIDKEVLEAVLRERLASGD